MERCRHLKVAQTDKATAHQPSSSDSQKRLSQTELILVGLASNVSRKNSFLETQADQDDRQRSIDMEDELQNSAYASVLNVQDDNDNEATPRTTKGHSKVTRASGGLEASGSKSTAPPRVLKGR